MRQSSRSAQTKLTRKFLHPPLVSSRRSLFRKERLSRWGRSLRLSRQVRNRSELLRCLNALRQRLKREPKPLSLNRRTQGNAMRFLGNLPGGKETGSILLLSEVSQARKVFRPGNWRGWKDQGLAAGSQRKTSRST